MEYIAFLSFLIILAAITLGGNNAACPVPDDVSEGSKEYTGTSSGATVTYKCRNGYAIANGTATRTCLDNGTWSDTLPICLDIDLNFHFVCNETGDISAVNPDPSTLIWAQASNEDGQCTTVFTEGNGSVIISGCSLDKPISLVYSPYTDGIPNLILNNVKFYNITCKTIPVDGILVVVTDSTWIRNLMKTSREPHRAPNIILNSEITGVRSEMENMTFTDNATVEINEQIRWRLFVPEPYIIQPLNCTAYSGEIDESGSKFSLDIIELGCTLDASLVTDFGFYNDTLRSEVFADLFAFRFPGSHDVEIVCSVKGCPPGSHKCDYTCGGRKRRSLPYISSASDYTGAVSAAEESAQGRYARAAGLSDPRNARIALTVIGPPNVGLEYLDYFSGSTQLVTFWAVAVTFTFAVVSRLIRI